MTKIRCSSFQRGLALTLVAAALIEMKNFRSLLGTMTFTVPISYLEAPIEMHPAFRSNNTSKHDEIVGKRGSRDRDIAKVLRRREGAERSNGNGIPPLNTINTAPVITTSEAIPTTPSSSDAYTSFCLLTKDDLDLLPEWIAYHYHTLTMRRIIVAVDPTSITSPKDVLEQWKSLFGLNYTLWTDTDYMPTDFLKGNFSNVPNYVKNNLRKNADGKWIYTWHQDQNVSQTQMLEDAQHINHHRFRQRTFLAECYWQLKQENRSWTVHIDPDEFITVNPLLQEILDECNTTLTVHNQNVASPKVVLNTTIRLPEAPTAGSLLTFWNDVYRNHKKVIGSSKCLLMPSLWFGAQERTEPLINTRVPLSSPSQLYFNASKFDTLRWNFHGDHAPRPKSIVKVSLIPDSHKIFREHRVYDPHIPLYRSGNKIDDCNRRNLVSFNVTRTEAVLQKQPKAMETVLSYPLYVHHYLGSLERYLARPDVRRTATMHASKQETANGFHDNGWIMGWLDNFVEEHGIDKSSKVLRGLMVRDNSG